MCVIPTEWRNLRITCLREKNDGMQAVAERYFLVAEQESTQRSRLKGTTRAPARDAAPLKDPPARRFHFVEESTMNWWPIYRLPYAIVGTGLPDGPCSVNLR